MALSSRGKNKAMPLTLRRTNTVLAVGLVIVIGLVLVLTLLGLHQLHGVTERLNTVVQQDHAKSVLVQQMRIAARERTVALLKMMQLTDPFDVDDEWMRFNELGGEFAAAREALLANELNASEHTLLDRQGLLTGRVAPAQRETAEYIRHGNHAAARRLLIDTVLPGQDEIFQVLMDLTALEEAAAARAVTDTGTDFRHATVLMLTLTTGTAVLGILIGVLVVRYMTRSTRALAEEKERAEITLHSIGDAVITTDEQGRIASMNAVAELLTRKRLRDALRHPVSEILNLAHEDNHTPIGSPVDEVIADGNVVTSRGDVLFVRHDGTELAIEYSVAPILDRERVLTGVIFVFRDVTPMRSLTRELVQHANHDSLTGLVNRREFERHLQRAIEEVSADNDIQHWLCYLDLDQFKLINDSCGHMAGDEWLRQVSGELRRQVRDSDLVARMGGDEFGVLLRYCSSRDAHEITERIRAGLQRMRFVWDNAHFICTASLGLVAVEARAGGLYELLSAADAACYVAKDQGRNRLHVYQTGDEAITRRADEMQWAQRIAAAIEENRFALVCQPIMPLGNEPEGMHFEILLAPLEHEGQSIPPAQFIPAAERYNLMSRVDRWVLRHSFAILQRLHAAGGLRRCTAAINLSAQSLCDDEFLEFVLELLARAPFDPHRLCFEITETAAIANLARATEFICSLKSLGCRFALDDFGSGLSSFAYLKSLPVDYLKIDGCFVRDISVDPIDRALVMAINQIGHVMKMRTIAECVEDRSAVAILRDIGVDFAQGYGVARPFPLEELIERRHQLTREGLVSGFSLCPAA
jgi:diguanylate cyclase (GGDEF)-like protein/PAS domain S-box-containing protein